MLNLEEKNKRTGTVFFFAPLVALGWQPYGRLWSVDAALWGRFSTG